MPDAFDVDEVVAQLTLEEKASLTMGSGLLAHGGGGAAGHRPDHGVRRAARAAGPARPARRAPARRARARRRRARLGGSVPATCFPTASGLGVVLEPGAVPYGRCRRSAGRPGSWGVSVLLGPGINMKRSPLCGRNFEYLSEDPWLAGELATAMVQGTQSQGVGTSLKHYAANNQEDDRLRVSAEVDERTLREIYLPAFERGGQARPAVDGHVRLQQGQRHLRLRAPLAADRGAARRVGLRRAGRLRLGCGARPGGRAGGRVSIWRCHRTWAQRRRPWSTAVRAGTLDEAVLDDGRPPGAPAGAAGPAGAGRGRRLRRGRAPRAGPAGGARVGGAAQERRRGAAAAAGRRSAGRGDRGVRPDAALPGRGQLAGQPDPARRRRWTS